MRKPFPREDLDMVVSQTADFWSTFRGARLFITGGTGFVGSWLLEVIQHANRIADSQIEVLALSRDPQKALDHAPHVFGAPDITLMRGNVLDFDENSGAFDLCIHAATDVADLSKASDALQVFDTNVAGTRRVLEFARSKGASRFLLTSSGAVYGPQPSTVARISEDYAGAPSTLDTDAGYGHGKRAAEWLTCAYGRDSGLAVFIARIYALVGPGIPFDGPFAAGNFIRDALVGRPIRINGDGRPLRSYLYMADACTWLFRILSMGKSGSAYNVGSEHEVSIAELARLIESLCDAPHTAEPGTPPQPGAAPRYIPDTTRARELLNVDEWTPLKTALSKTINWSRNKVAV